MTCQQVSCPLSTVHGTTASLTLDQVFCLLCCSLGFFSITALLKKLVLSTLGDLFGFLTHVWMFAYLSILCNQLMLALKILNLGPAFVFSPRLVALLDPIFSFISKTIEYHKRIVHMFLHKVTFHCN